MVYDFIGIKLVEMCKNDSNFRFANINHFNYVFIAKEFRSEHEKNFRGWVAFSNQTQNQEGRVSLSILSVLYKLWMKSGEMPGQKKVFLHSATVSVHLARNPRLFGTLCR